MKNINHGTMPLLPRRKFVSSTDTHTYHEAEITVVQRFLCTGEDVRVQTLTEPNYSWSEEAVTACLLTPETNTFYLLLLIRKFQC